MIVFPFSRLRGIIQTGTDEKKSPKELSPIFRIIMHGLKRSKNHIKWVFYNVDNSSLHK
jgi:hypothetical protein